MAHDTVYYVPLDDDGIPTSNEPLEAYYDETLEAWVGEGRTIEYLGHIVGLNGVFSSQSRDEVAEWLDNRE